MLNWMSAQAPFQDISTGKWLQNHCSHHERCNTIGSSNIKPTKKSYKSKDEQWTNYILNTEEGKFLFHDKKNFNSIEQIFSQKLLCRNIRLL
jgi:predicted RNA-binding protein (virulence factor B family)